ncbi:MAG: gamma-glutamyltransferase family protein [Acidobacteriota bacterium]
MRHVIAAGDRTTAEAAKEILWVGGNAFDAAVGAVFTAMVAEPSLTSAGGGGHLMAAPESGKPILFDFFVDMPTKSVQISNLDFFSVDLDFGSAQQEFHIGKGSVAVPGNVAGLLYVHGRLGTLPRKEILSPAIRAAREGVVLSESQAYLVNLLSPILTHDEKGAEVFSPNGSLLRAGDRLVMPEFADFLDALAQDGADLVYRGEVAKIISDWAEDGGLLCLEDLAHYQVQERSPLRTDFYAYQVLLNPPPAQSGVLIDATLSLLQKARRKEATPVSLRELVTSFDVTNQARRERLPVGSTEGIQFPLSQQEYFQDYLDRFRRAISLPSGAAGPPPRGATTHVSVLDKVGNAASVTTTNGEGCGYMLPKAGFILNNMLGEEDLNPRGFHLYPGGTRLPSMVAPTIVLKGRRPVLITGSAGSNRIRSAIAQLLVNCLCNKMSIEEATAAPRVHLEGNVLHAEPGIPEDSLQKLESRYTVHRWDEQNPFFGGANSVTLDTGAGDSRRGGYSLRL